MNEHRGVGQHFFYVRNTKFCLIFFILTIGDRVKRIFGPSIVPINRAAVDDRRELSTSVSELLTDWGESQHNVKSFSALRHKVSVDLITIITLTDRSSAFCKFITNVDLFIWREQVWNFARVKKIIDVFKEGFSDDLSIAEQELDSLLIKSARP